MIGEAKLRELIESSGPVLMAASMFVANPVQANLNPKVRPAYGFAVDRQSFLISESADFSMADINNIHAALSDENSSEDELEQALDKAMLDLVHKSSDLLSASFDSDVEVSAEDITDLHSLLDFTDHSIKALSALHKVASRSFNEKQHLMSERLLLGMRQMHYNLSLMVHNYELLAKTEPVELKSTFSTEDIEKFTTLMH